MAGGQTLISIILAAAIDKSRLIVYHINMKTYFTCEILDAYGPFCNVNGKYFAFTAKIVNRSPKKAIELVRKAVRQKAQKSNMEASGSGVPVLYEEKLFRENSSKNLLEEGE